jgi:hypothetical protein
MRRLLDPARCGAVPASGQSLELAPEQLKANIGDVLTIRITARLPEGQELLDFAPRTLLTPPEGMRIVSADTLVRNRNGEYHGTVRMAFYRIGRQPVPTLALLYRPAPGASPDTLVHAPLAIEIIPILPAGNPEIKDIRPLRLLGGPVWAPLAILVTIVVAGLYWLAAGTVLRLVQGPSPRPSHRPTDVPDRLGHRSEHRERNGIVPLFGGGGAGSTTLVEARCHTGLTTPEVPVAPAPLAAGDLAESRRDCWRCRPREVARVKPRPGGGGAPCVAR